MEQDSYHGALPYCHGDFYYLNRNFFNSMTYKCHMPNKTMGHFILH